MSGVLVIKPDRIVLGGITIGGIALRKKSITVRESDEILAIADMDKRTEYIMGLIPDLLSGTNGEKVDVDVKEMAIEQGEEIIDTCIFRKDKKVFTPAPVPSDTGASQESKT